MPTLSEYQRVRRSLFFAPLFAPMVAAFAARAQPVVPPDVAAEAAPLLAALIQAARGRAIAAGVSPMPPAIQRALYGFFPASLLWRVRYTTAGVAPISIPGLALSYGRIEAVTLIDVIMFRDERDARTNAKLWAHELTHVMQFERWGVDGFARRYIEDYAAVEREARDNAARFMTWSHQASGENPMMRANRSR
jgi:Domain of unknown function (DUF4157)